MRSKKLLVKEKSTHHEVALQVIKKKLTVRATERLVQVCNSGDQSKEKDKKQEVRSEAIIRVEDLLQKEFSTNVSIHHSDKKGKIEIEYYGKADLNRVLELLGVSPNEK